MSKKASKEQEAMPEVSAKGPSPFQAGATGQSGGDEPDVQAYWNETVDELKEKEFESIEQAISTVVDAIIARLAIPAAEHSGIKKYLFTLLDTDPELKSDLEESLNIRG